MSELISQLGGAATSGQDPVAVLADLTLVIGPVDVQAYDRFGLYAYNVGGGLGNALKTTVIETAPENTATLWTTLDADVFGVPIAVDGVAFAGYSGQAVKYLRVRSQCAAAENTTARFWLCAGGHP